MAGTGIVGDNPDELVAAVRHALSLADVVLTTGGLGPTRDDLTRDALMQIFGGELYLDETTTANVERVMASRGRQMNKLTALQAMVPTSATVIQNPVGTAPILWFEADGKVVVAMPGVPFELREVFVSEVLPRLKKRFQTEELHHAYLQTANIAESAVAELFAPLYDIPGLYIAYLPQTGYLNLRFDSAVQAVADEACARAAEILKDYVISYTNDSPAQTLIGALRRRGYSVATAESCTGGNIAHEITAIAGCSDVMMGGVVAYSNSVKQALLGVPEADLREHGAVSEPVARAMAEGVRRATGADVGIATTGIAGPGGGTPDKPVGTTAFCRRFPGSRSRVIAQATAAALLSALTATQAPSPQ